MAEKSNMASESIVISTLLLIPITEVGRGHFGNQSSWAMMVNSFLSWICATPHQPVQVAGFRALYHVWGRCRKGLLQRWEEQEAAHVVFNTGKGRKVTDAVWRCEARAELATRGGCYAVLCLHLTKAFDLVDHRLLVQELLACAVPVHLLRIIVHAYRWPIFLTLDGLVANPLWPDRGIPAGCFSATYAQRGFLVRALVKTTVAA